MKIGVAKYGNGKKEFKIKDGSNVYRILPPLGNLADKGWWSKFYKVQWGFKDSNNKHRPFLDVRKVNYKTKMVEVESAAHVLTEHLKEKRSQVIEAFKAKRASKEDLQKANDLVKQYNVDSKWYLNVVNLNGEIGLLKINTKYYNGLDEEIKKLRADGIDPLGIQTGVFFDFFRSNATGKVQDYLFKVDVYKEKVNANVNGVNTVIEQRKTHVMDAAFIDRLANEAYELEGMYPVVTPEQIELMVNEGVPAIESILGKSEKKTDIPAQTTVIPATQTTVEMPVTQAPAQSATLAVEPPTPPYTAQVIPTSTTNGNTELLKEELSDEDFMAQLGVDV